MQRADAPRRPPRGAAPRVAGVWLAMLGLGLALRVGGAWLASDPAVVPGSEVAVVDGVAWSLARGAGFSLDSGTEPRPTASIPPLVPWLTSLLYRVIGHRPFTAVLLQCAIGALVPLLLAALGSSLFGGVIGRWAGWVAAIDPLLVLVSGSLVAGTTVCATLLLALWLSAEWVRAPRGGRALGSGLAWGASVLSHPVALLLPAVVAAWAWRPLGLTVGGRGRIRQLGLLALGLVVVVGPWTVRNALVLHAFVPVTTGAGTALLAANGPGAWSASVRDVATGNPRAGGTPDPDALEAPPRGAPEAEADAWSARRAWAFMSGHVREWPEVARSRLVSFWRPAAHREERGGWLPHSPLRSLLPFWAAFALPFAVWGALRAARGGRRWFQALPLLIIPVFVLVGLVFPGPRGRIPIEPLVALLAALGLEDARRIWRSRGRRLTLVPRRGAAAPPAG